MSQPPAAGELRDMALPALGEVLDRAAAARGLTRAWQLADPAVAG